MSYYLRRALPDALNEMPAMDVNEAATQDTETQFDPRIFWAVNACFVVAVVGLCCYFGFGDRSCFTLAHERRRQTDLEYQRNLVEREERKRQAQIMSPEKRTRLLLASFKKHQVMMTVKERDLIANPEAVTAIDDDRDDTSLSASSLSNQLLLQLPTGRKVPNCCAICLGDYEVDDQVVWSSTDECGHAFHLQCLLDWLIKMQPSTPCPCCRAEFTDWEAIRREEKIVWTPGNTFNPNVIRLTENVRNADLIHQR